MGQVEVMEGLRLQVASTEAKDEEAGCCHWLSQARFELGLSVQQYGCGVQRSVKRIIDCRRLLYQCWLRMRPVTDRAH